jgi:hypothetical protein
LVEQRTENPRVGSSILPLAIPRASSLEEIAMNYSAFFFMLLSFTGAGIAVVAAIALAIRYVKRLPASPGQLSAEDIDAIRARLDELEQRDVRVEELEERLDFVERALGRAREAAPLRNPSKE